MFVLSVMFSVLFLLSKRDLFCKHTFGVRILRVLNYFEFRSRTVRFVQFGAGEGTAEPSGLNNGRAFYSKALLPPTLITNTKQASSLGGKGE